jgi:hypothetical protein
MSFKLQIDQACIENEGEYKGYCSVKVLRENGETWIELHGNEEESAYPLVLATVEDVDQFSKKLKMLLTKNF